MTTSHILTDEEIENVFHLSTDQFDFARIVEAAVLGVEL